MDIFRGGSYPPCSFCFIYYFYSYGIRIYQGKHAGAVLSGAALRNRDVEYTKRHYRRQMGGRKSLRNEEFPEKDLRENDREDEGGRPSSVYRIIPAGKEHDDGHVHSEHLP